MKLFHFLSCPNFVINILLIQYTRYKTQLFSSANHRHNTLIQIDTGLIYI